MVKPFLKKYKRVFLITFSFLVGLMVLFILIMRFSTLQERLLIFPSPKASEAKYTRHISERNPITHYVKTPDNICLHGFQYKNKAQEGELQRKVILLFNGSTKNVIKAAHMTEMLLETGCDVFCIDYRGYGKSTGRVRKEADFLNDAKAIYQYLVQQQAYSPEKIILCGYSLGGAPAHYVAAHPDLFPAGMITIGTFSDLASIKWKWLSQLILRYKLNNGECIPKIKCPILILHGTKDKKISIENARYLYEKAKRNKKDVLFVTYEGGHGHFLDDPNARKTISEAITSFCDKVTKGITS